MAKHKLRSGNPRLRGVLRWGRTETNRAGIGQNGTQRDKRPVGAQARKGHTCDFEHPVEVRTRRFLTSSPLSGGWTPG